MRTVMCQVTTLAVVVTLVLVADKDDARAKDQKDALVNNQEDATGGVLHKLKCR